MISKLPTWVLVIAWGFAFIAGMVNVVGLLGFERTAVTHLTGNTTLLAAAFVASDWPLVLHFAALIGSFVLGAAISGIVIRDSPLQLGRRHGAALALASALLFASAPLLQRHGAYGLYAAACAIGLQNAIISTYSGAIVRTSHVSGMFTDLGIFLGQAIRVQAIDHRRLGICVAVISGFLCGGLAGTYAFHVFSYSALLFPASLAAAASVACWVSVPRIAAPGA